MGIFGKSKANILATAFYQYGLEDNNLDDLCVAEAGGSKKGVLRETDYSVEVENANNKKTIEKFDGYYFNYIVLAKTYDFQKCDNQIVDQVATSNLLIRKKEFDLTGGFRVDLSRAEDHEFCLAIKKMGLYFITDRKMVVWHYLSPSGRNSGHFSYFNNQKRYYSSFLRTRVDIMSDHARLRLLFLPILDLFFLVFVFYFLLIGGLEQSRLKRINDQQIASEFSKFSKFRIVIFLVLENARCYFMGLSLVYKKLLIIFKA